MSFRKHIHLLEFFDLLESLLTEAPGFDDYVTKLKSVQELINRGATEGEKDAARSAKERILKRIEDEFGKARRDKAEATVAQTKSTTSDFKSSSGSGYKPNYNSGTSGSTPPTPKFKVGDWVVSKRDNIIGKVTKFSYDRISGQYVYVFGNSQIAKEHDLYRATEEEIKKATAPKFKVGDWVKFGADVGKIAKYDTKTGLYRIYINNDPDDWIDHRESALTKATQEDIDSAASKKSSKDESIFKVGDWIKFYSEDDNLVVGKISKVNTGNYTYFIKGMMYVNLEELWGYEPTIEVDFDMVEKATFTDIAKAQQNTQAAEAKEKAKRTDSPKSNSETPNGWTGPKSGWTITNIAHYVNLDEGSDKIYGVATKNGQWRTFWGKFRSKPSFKPMSRSEAMAIFADKAKRYKIQDPNNEFFHYLDHYMAAW